MRSGEKLLRVVRAVSFIEYGSRLKRSGAGTALGLFRRFLTWSPSCLQSFQVCSDGSESGLSDSTSLSQIRAESWRRAMPERRSYGPETASWFSACLIRCSSCQRSAVDSPASTRSSSACRRLELRRARARRRSPSRSTASSTSASARSSSTLKKPGPGRELEHLVRTEVDARRAGLERRDERRVAREHADLAGRARHDHHLRLALERRTVGRDERRRRTWARPLVHVDRSGSSCVEASLRGRAATSVLAATASASRPSRRRPRSCRPCRTPTRAARRACRR